MSHPVRRLTLDDVILDQNPGGTSPNTAPGKERNATKYSPFTGLGSDLASGLGVGFEPSIASLPDLGLPTEQRDEVHDIVWKASPIALQSLHPCPLTVSPNEDAMLHLRRLAACLAFRCSTPLLPTPSLVMLAAAAVIIGPPPLPLSRATTCARSSGTVFLGGSRWPT